MSLNPSASGFIPFGASSAAAAASSSSANTATAAPTITSKMPERPPPTASMDEHAAWKVAVQKYLDDIKKEKARLEVENAAKLQQQQQQQKHSFIVETVYADEVGYGDDDDFDDEDADYFEGFGENLGNGGDNNNNNNNDDEVDDLKPVAEGKEGPASKFEGKDLDADELFRLAKNAARCRSDQNIVADFFGIDAELFARTGFDLASHRDSFNRNAMHFAAEGGCVPLILELKKKFGEGALQACDDKGIQPWQVAVLCKHRSDVSRHLLPSTGVAGINSINDLDSPDLLSALMQRFAPKSAAAALAFGAKPPEFSNKHTVWGTDPSSSSSNAAAVPSNVRTMSIQCSTLNIEELASLEAFDAICNSFGHTAGRQAGGLSSATWAAPRQAVDFASRQQFTHLVAAFNDKTGDGAFCGAVVFSAAGSLSGRGVTQAVSGRDAYVVSHAAVAPNAPAGTLHSLMKQSHVDYQGSAVFLRTAAKLPVAGAPIAQCKWMYRIVRPWNIYVDREAEKNMQLAAMQKQQSQSSSSSSVFCPLRAMLAADYFKFSSTSLVDTVVRQGIADSFPVAKGELAQWEVLRPGTVSETDCESIAAVACSAVAAEAAVGVAWSGLMVKAISESVDLRFCVRRGGGNGAVSDVMALRLVTPLGAEQHGTITAAVLVALLTPTVAKGRRAVVAAAVAAVHCGADVIFTANTFGLNNADLVNCFFEDLPGSIEKIYCLAGVDKSLAGVTPLQSASGCYIPFF